ncbi:MAG TPA: mycothiol synthase [Ilumatobacteraceae bacterium]|nr:mycothiol synthase [Ilumatobacteraceae bacterium]
MRQLEIERQMDADAIASVSALLTDVERADGHKPLSDHLWVDLVSGGRAGFVGVIAPDGDRDGGSGTPVAYVQASRANASWMLELVVAPSHRGDLVAIGRDLIRAAFDVIGAEGGGRVDWWVFEPTPAHDELAAAIGMRPERQLLQMRRPLPTEQRPTIGTRPFVPGTDEDAWLTVNNRAFAAHREQGGWDRETLELREHEPWFDPEGFLLHERDGRLAGFCWTKIHTDHDPALGEIYVIGVDPDFQGLGLGKQLTLAGLDSIARREVSVGILYVDADNTAAVNLYTGLGFTIHRTDRAYVGEVPHSVDGPERNSPEEGP